MEGRFSEIEITNFRGFDYLKIENLRKLNVFVGANNVGKTSILEAVFMLAGMSNPLISNRVNYLRTLLTNNIDTARYLFHNVDFTNKPLLKGTIGDVTRRLTFAPAMISDERDASSNNSLSRFAIRQLNFDFDTKGEGQFDFHTKLVAKNDGSLQQTDAPGYKENVNALFIPVDKNDSSAAANFSLLVKRNRKQWVVDALHDFDASIESIEALPDGLYLKIKDLQELLPIGMAGDGVRRMISIISAIAYESCNIVLIDEIDNGMHYSAHKLMWNVILQFIEKHDIQLFVTTHNWDCLLGLRNVMQEHEEFQDLANIYTIAKTQREGFQAYCYDYSNLDNAIDNEIEIRR